MKFIPSEFKLLNIFKFEIIKFLLLGVFTLYASSVLGQHMTVASYNLRYDNPGDSLNNWQYREKALSKLIRFHDFDIFGTQEGLEHQLEQLVSDLPGYNFIGVGRDDGKKAGEHSAIFYKTDKYRLEEKGDFWLSEDPSKPNKGWDAVLPRICSWGKFKVKDTGFEFYFFNVHFDHVGTKARKESAKLILKKIKEYTGDYPVILTGDFNVDQHSPSYQILNASKKLEDAYTLADLNYGANGTYNGFNPNARSDSRIDHIFVTRDFKINRHGILTDSYKTDVRDIEKLANSGNYPKEIELYKTQTRLPSDHYPVMVTLEYQAK